MTRTVGLAAAGMLVLTGCAGSSPDDASSSAAGTNEELTSVTFALDWAPNTNHTGLYVADELGYFEEAGIELEIIPYGSTTVSELVSAGEADFGLEGQSSVQTARSSGRDVKSVYAITQSDTGRMVVMEDSEFTRPADLDGKIFGGLGDPHAFTLATTTIQGDGGKGEFTEVMLDSSAYDALAQGRVDFTLAVSTWESVRMKLDGRPYREFRYQDYGVPDTHSTGIVSSDAFLEAHPELARYFVQAVARGYEYAAENPSEAADILIDANQDILADAEELVHESQQLFAEDGYITLEGRQTGTFVSENWTEFGAFLFEAGFLTDSNGETLTEEPDWTEYYTNDLVK